MDNHSYHGHSSGSEMGFLLGGMLLAIVLFLLFYFI
ncbi:MAG: hypothetical protein UT85_C0038G0005 [Candidatus Levybacteria bacterium GW2011_GWA2_40_16]|nr:MAG: hypothetical protein UT85_C0038G0005 [Candidatus Levybacteria bacterium GW2011_GWA2_40_16]